MSKNLPLALATLQELALLLVVPGASAGPSFIFSAVLALPILVAFAGEFAVVIFR